MFSLKTCNNKLKNKNNFLYLLTSSNTKQVDFWNRRIILTDFTVVKRHKGKKHYAIGHAVIEYDGIIPFKKEWYCYGKIKKSAIWTVFIRQNTWYFNDESYVTIVYFENGAIQHIYRYNSSHQYHCSDGPASITYFENGFLRNEEWYFDNVMHRLHGPSKTEYYENGQKLEEWWKVDGKLHRLDGPAFIYNYESGNTEENWYVNNVHMPKISY